MYMLWNIIILCLFLLLAKDSQPVSKAVVLAWSSLAQCFGVRVSVMFYFMFVHYTFSSVWVAKLPPFGKKLPARLAICFHCILSIFNFYLFPILV